MEKKFVYVLLSEWSIDYERDSDVRVFYDEKDAKKVMEEEWKTFVSEVDEEKWNDLQFGEDYAWCCEEGDWTANRCTWNIHKCEIDCKFTIRF